MNTFGKCHQLWFKMGELEICEVVYVGSMFICFNIV